MKKTIAKKGVRLGNKSDSKTGNGGSTSSTPVFKLTIKCLGRKFASEAETFEGAVNRIKIPNGARMLSTITVEKGDIKKTRIINARHTNGLFGQGSPTMKSIHIKNVKAMLGV